MDYKQRDLRELNDCIASLQNVVSLSPKSDPRSGLARYLMARERFRRYSLSGQHDDLEASILSFTEVIHLPLPRDMHHMLLRIFYELAVAVLRRSEEFKRREDIKFCIICFHYLRGQRHEVLINIPVPVAAALLRALAVQVKSSFGDVDQDIKEIADLCDELLDSDTPIEPLTIPISSFAMAIDHYLGELADDQIPSEKVISCLRKATLFLPDFHQTSILLAGSLVHRWALTSSDDDHGEAMATVDKLVRFRAPDGTPSPYKRQALVLLAATAKRQFLVNKKPEVLEPAIYHIRNSLDESPYEHELHDMLIQYLSELTRMCFPDSRVTWSLQGTMSSASAMRPPFRELSATLHEFNEASLLGTPASESRKFLDILLPSISRRLTDIADIRDGIHYCRKVLASYPDSLFSSLARYAIISLLGRAFECTKRIEFLNEAISSSRRDTNTTDPILKGAASFELVRLLQTRFLSFQRREDLDELMRLFPIVANYEKITAEHRSELSYQWAMLAHYSRHRTTSMAYDNVMSSIQASLTFAPTLALQHSRLVAMSGVVKTTPLDYASYQISMGQLKQAIETLEQGRALLWSEMRGLRTSMDQIRLASPYLADKVEAINKELEALTMAISPNNDVTGVSSGSGLEGMDPYGRAMRQRKLLDDREKHISEVQALPGSEAFLKPPSFDNLHFAASHGPVIVINHSEFHSDIVVLLHNAPPSLIPTSKDFYYRAIKLQDRLLEEREKRLKSNTYEDALRWVLKELYDLVGQPVIKRLHQLGIPEQSRVWWCPTSVFCSLPLHAMGPIPSEVGLPRYFLDLYIPSYTPSLSALIESRKPCSRTSGKPSMLLVVQPDAFMVQASEEMQAIQAVRPRATTLIDTSATRSVVLEHIRNHRFVHFVCHGILQSGKPFDSSFKLYQGERLSLLDIVRSRLPNAEFAFLAACHTAELTRESPSDEALHLSAAMQYCGFRSVVGTMWAMADTDGPDLARNFYGSLFSGRKQGGHYYERTAEALRQAVMRLRRKRGITLERWVNYVHYGA